MEEILEKCNKARGQILNLTKSEIENLINAIKIQLSNNIDIIEDAYKVENEEKFNKELFLEGIKTYKFNYGKVEDTVKNEYGIINKLYIPYGIIGMIYDGNIYATIDMIVKSIQTRNGLVLSTYKKVGMIYILVKEIEKVLKEVGAEGLIGINSNMTDMLKAREIEKIFYIGKRESYENIKAETRKEIEYRGYKKYEMYIEDEIDKGLIGNIEKAGKVDLYRKGKEVKNMEEAIKRINTEGGKYSVGIMVADSEKARKFAEEIKATNVFINEAPTMTNILNIECEDLIYRKNITVYE